MEEMMNLLWVSKYSSVQKLAAKISPLDINISFSGTLRKMLPSVTLYEELLSLSLSVSWKDLIGVQFGFHIEFPVDLICVFIIAAMQDSSIVFSAKIKISCSDSSHNIFQPFYTSILMASYHSLSPPGFVHYNVPLVVDLFIDYSKM